MAKIVTTKQIEKLTNELHQQNKRIVLTGGCFDILHVGHITFLEKAKKQGDVLLVLLEADETITSLKGPQRPINTQEGRAIILAALSVVDMVILLEPWMSDKAYDNLVILIKPAIIATTKGDGNRFHKERQAKISNAKVVDVTMHISDASTTKLITLLQEG